MVVVSRNDVRRNRLIFFLALILSVFAIANIVTRLISGPSDAMRPILILIGLLAGLAIILSLLQLYGYPNRSQVLIFQSNEDMVVATNALHEGFKFRFLRDILGDNMTSLTDEDRAHWKALEADRFYATLRVRNVRKLILVRLCTMIFDDVFVADASNRWEHHDSASTAEPSFSKREMPRLTSWKSST
jgi:hypothetical protein